MTIPRLERKWQLDASYAPRHFLDSIRALEWQPGIVPQSVIYTYAIAAATNALVIDAMRKTVSSSTAAAAGSAPLIPRARTSERLFRIAARGPKTAPITNGTANRSRPVPTSPGMVRYSPARRPRDE